MTDFMRQEMSRDEALSFAGLKGVYVDERDILFDPGVDPQYEIRRQATHDGTRLFSVDLMRTAFFPLLAKMSYYIPMGDPPEGMEPRYTIGRVKRFAVFGLFSVPAGTIYGMRERVVIPVRVKFVPAAPV